MYTRLYTRVLNRYHWMYSATAYNHAYNDSGIFCIIASCHPNQLQELTQVRGSSRNMFVTQVCYSGAIERVCCHHWRHFRGGASESKDSAQVHAPNEPGEQTRHI